MRRQSRAARQILEKRERARAIKEKEDHEKYHVGKTPVLQCRYCKANYVDFRKMKGRETE